MANIALIGASGNIGSCILTEALSRSHRVTGIVRNPEKLTPRAGLTIAQGDLADSANLAKLINGADAMVVSLRWTDNADKVIEAARLANVQRVLVVVGAGSLEASPGVRVIDTPEFPTAWRPGAEGAARALATFRAETQLDWVAFSPSWTIAPGERTGQFRIGGNQLLRDAQGESRISREDFAVAIVDEIEKPQQHRQRITIGY